MSYKLTIDQKPAYLHIIVTGHNSKETVMHYMEEVMRECTNRKCGNVLVEERLEGQRLGTFDVFSMVSEGSKRFVGTFHAMAYVDLNGDGGLMQFAENVAVNRGIPIQIYSNIPDAEKWLLHQAQNRN